MGVVSEPQYDGDLATKAYVDGLLRTINGEITTINGDITTRSQNFGSEPIPPYYINDTYMNGTDIYICTTQRLIGSYNSADWSKASAYTDDTLASTKNKVFTSTPTTPYRLGDLWAGGPNGELRRCVNTRLTGTYNAADWENATVYDSTETVVEGGLVTTGTIQVVQGGTVAAGMTGNTSGDTAVRFWAGSTSGNRNSAPFRVTQGGAVTASNMNIIGGSIDLQSSDTTYTTLKVKDSSDSTYYSGLNGKGFTLWHGDKRRVYLTQILSTSFLVVRGEDDSQAMFSSQGSSNTSDIRLKCNTKNIDLKTSYDIINTLKPIEFTYKNGNITHRGLSAQQVKKVLNKKGIKNQIYSKDLDNKYYMLNYNEFIPDLINCIKYQNKKINTLEKRLEKIEKRLEKIEKGGR